MNVIAKATIEIGNAAVLYEVSEGTPDAPYHVEITAADRRGITRTVERDIRTTAGTTALEVLGAMIAQTAEMIEENERTTQEN